MQGEASFASTSSALPNQLRTDAASFDHSHGNLSSSPGQSNRDLSAEDSSGPPRNPQLTEAERQGSGYQNVEGTWPQPVASALQPGYTSPSSGGSSTAGKLGPNGRASNRSRLTLPQQRCWRRPSPDDPHSSSLKSPLQLENELLPLLLGSTSAADNVAKFQCHSITGSPSNCRMSSPEHLLQCVRAGARGPSATYSAGCCGNPYPSQLEPDVGGHHPCSGTGVHGPANFAPSSTCRCQAARLPGPYRLLSTQAYHPENGFASAALPNDRVTLQQDPLHIAQTTCSQIGCQCDASAPHHDWQQPAHMHSPMRQPLLPAIPLCSSMWSSQPQRHDFEPIQYSGPCLSRHSCCSCLRAPAVGRSCMGAPGAFILDSAEPDMQGAAMAADFRPANASQQQSLPAACSTVFPEPRSCSPGASGIDPQVCCLYYTYEPAWMCVASQA